MESEAKFVPPDEDDTAENLIDDETYEGGLMESSVMDS